MSKKTKIVALCGVFTALAFIFSYVEMLLPISLGIPGIKLGLANCCAIVLIYLVGGLEATVVNGIRVILANVLFGNFSSFLFSLAGAVLSMAAMLLLKKTKIFSPVAVSVTGGVMHNIGQIIAAVFIMENAAIAYYLPVLLITGIITGAVIGILATVVINRMAVYVR